MTKDKLKLLDLFSGIGGFSLGLERTGGFETVAFCEYDEKAQKVLKKHWPDVPIYKDVRTLDYEGSVDVITGGYPCQPFSVAGKRKGAEDDRHLWPSMFSLIQKHRPSWVIGENVAGHINMGLDNVLADLESEGYRTRTFVIPACAVNAKHRRDRVWIVGHPEHDGSSSPKVRRSINKASNHDKEGQIEAFEFEGTSQPTNNEVVANTNMQRCKRPSQARNDGKDRPKSNDKQFRGCCATYELSEKSKNQWAVEPNVGRVAHGIPRRVDRLKQLGNAVVPQIPEILGNAILEVENYNTMNTKSKKEQ